MHELHRMPVPALLSMTPQGITDDVLNRHMSAGKKFWLVAAGAAGLLALGAIGFLMLLGEGFEDRGAWAYYAAIFAYIFSVSQSAVLVSVALRMVKAHWRRPLARISEMFAAVGVFAFIMMIPLLWVLPPIDGRRSLWFEAPGYSPHVWDTIAMGFLVINGLALLYFASLPDLATLRDNSSKRQGLYRKLALSWAGTRKQWKLLHAGIGTLGGFYFMFLIFVHMLISVDFSMSLVPGWKDAIYPAHHALSGLQSGVAVVLVTMFILRKSGGLRSYLEVDQFWGLSKLLLALSLLWFYFWWSSFFTYWYGRTPAEQGVLKLLMFESYKPAFVIAFLLSSLLPFLILMWNVVRKTAWGPALAGIVVLTGTFFNMIRLYVPAFSIEDPTLHALENVPPANLPGLTDVLVVAGALGGAVLFYMLATRIFPITSIWELKEGLLLQRMRRFLKTEVRVLAKPE